MCKGLSGNLFIGPYVIFDADLHIGLKDGFALNKLLCQKKKMYRDYLNMSSQQNIFDLKKPKVRLMKLRRKNVGWFGSSTV